MAQATYTFQPRDGVWRGYADAAPGTPLTALVRRVACAPVFTLYDDSDLTTPIANTFVSTQSYTAATWKLTLDV